MWGPSHSTIVEPVISQSQNTRPFAQVNPQEFVAFCDGLEDAGLVEYARRGRVLARELAESQQRVEQLEETLRRVEAERDRWRDDRWREAHGQPWPR